MIRLLADENMVGLSALASPGLQIRTVAGRAIDRAAVAEADALWVRSVTPVTADLLAGSPVRFVGTATAGTEHIDETWLRASGIAFSAAPGSNANAVVEYVLGALLETGAWAQLEEGGSLGIVGYGHVGQRLAAVASRLGWRTVVSDPPLAASRRERGEDGAAMEASLAQVLACDVISLHSSLERDGPWPSYHLLGEEELAQLRSHQLLINASRGAVIDNAALCNRLAAGAPPQVVLDVWEGEPDFTVRLLDFDALRIATPHIAGYSRDARHQATLLLYARLRELYPDLPAPPDAGGDPNVLDGEGIDDARALLRCCYRIDEDDRRFRALKALESGARAKAFDRLRKEYPLRRELAHSVLGGVLCDVLGDEMGSEQKGESGSAAGRLYEALHASL